MHRHFPIAALLLLNLAIATLYAIYTPPWQAPDEPAHYNYIRQLAAGHLPIMQPSDYGQDYQSAVISSKFAPQYSIEPFTYEDYQPPLYYALQTPIFWLSDGRLLPLRLFSVLLGGVTLLLAYGVAQHLFNGRSPLVLTASAFFALLPQHIAMQASVNNDALSELLIAALLFGLVSAVLPHPPPLPRRVLLPLGLLLGLAFLTKATAYLMAPVIALALVWHTWGDWRNLGRSALFIFAPALLIGALWWGRNLAVYGWPDFMGIQAHNAAVVGQPQTAEWVKQFGLSHVLAAFGRTTFQSFWGQFGWMGVLMPGWLYRGLGLFTAACALGLLLLWWQRRTAASISPQHRLTAALLAALFLLNLALYLSYNLTYVQHQGRYLFASLIPISLAVALGLNGWAQLAAPTFDSRRFLPFLLAFALAALDIFALFRLIVPALAR